MIIIKSNEHLLEVKNLKKWFLTKNNSILKKEKEYLKAVDGVSLNVSNGETLGIVGESGCGKTTLGQLIMRLIDSDSGEIIFDGTNFLELNKRELMKKRSDIQMIFQDPYESLDPHMTIYNIIAEPLEIQKMPKDKINDRINELMELVGLNTNYKRRYAHEFSGGQRQRIVISRALATKPKLVICDEPVSALDVSIRAQIINLMKDIQKQTGVAYIFISHDLSVVKYISDRVAVMYLGKIIELASKKELYANPLHPYTKALLSAIPIPSVDIKRNPIILKGDIPSPVRLPSGCRFRTRCPFAKDICKTEEPILNDISNNHLCACHFAQKFNIKSI